jgi:TolB-like protein/class 3 adenylate cyclase/Flp pilus assembly protein TadD
MATMTATRRLAAVLAADVAGYSRLVGADEEGTLSRLKALRAKVIDPKIAEHRGRIVKTTGDGLLVEFASVVDTLRCAVEIQATVAESNAPLPADKRIQFRIGINVGDIVVEEDDIFGDGVNVAARLEGMAEPGGICVSERVQEDAAGRLDLAFDDMGEQTLKNIARRVRVYRVRGIAAAKSPSAPATPVQPFPEKPSIAVLPFQNITGDPEQEYFVDGMVEEIITALSRIRWLFVLARNSSFTYKGQAVDVKRAGRELGVRYLLEGSVRKAGNRVRIAGQLIEAETGAHLWADRFDGLLEDVFDLQDKVASAVAGVIEPALQAAEIRRSAERPTSDLTAYDLYLRALSLYEGGRAGVQEALELLGRAIERDPDYGPALALAAHCHQVLDIIGWSNDPATNRNEGIDLARKALRVARDDPDVLGRAAHAFGYFGEDLDAAIALVDRARELNPSFALGWFRSGWLRLWRGEPDLAIEHFQTSLRLSPRNPIAASFLGIGVGHVLSRQFEEARAMLLRSLQESPNSVPTHRWLAVCCAHMGRLEEAREMINRLRAIIDAAPSGSPYRNPEHRELVQDRLRAVLRDGASPYRNPEHRELYLSGLRLALGETV